MTERHPIHSEESIRFMEMRRSNQQYSYDLTQRLTFFVISIELVFCGYLLLNFDKLAVLKYSGLLFLLSGLAAIFGIFWRFCYNQTYHDNAHEGKSNKFLNKIQLYFYWVYVALTLLFLLGIIVTGYHHISNIENSSKQTPPPKYEKSLKEINSSIEGLQNSIMSLSSSISKLAEVNVIDKDIKKTPIETEKRVKIN